MSALTFLGLARRAGRIEYGDEGAAMAARSGKTRLIVLSSDAGHTTAARAENASGTAHCPVAVLPFTKAQLGAALGRETVSVAAVTDVGFAAAFMEKLAAETGGYGEILADLREKNGKARERERERLRHEAKLRRGGKK